jgi:ribosomal protein S18 acetylase RimI-like enzyme
MLVLFSNNVIQYQSVFNMNEKSKRQNPIIRLGDEGIPIAARVHTRAFLTDPFTLYTLKSEHRRIDQLFFLMSLTLRYAVRYGEVFATQAMEGVAAWLPPGSSRESNWRMLRVGALSALWHIGLRAIQSYRIVMQLTDKLHDRYAPEPHWYLSQLGVDPEFQGQGIGHYLLAPTLERIDHEKSAAYLETLNPKALPFYTRLGFRVCEEIRLPKNGPVLWSMRREPQG